MVTNDWCQLWRKTRICSVSIPMHSRYTFTNIVKSYKDRLPKPISLNFTMPLLPALRAVLSCCLHCAQCEICLLHLLLPSSMCAWACLFSFVLVDSIGELLLWYCCWVYLTYVLSMSIFFLIKISADSGKTISRSCKINLLIATLRPQSNGPS